jgi:hypothetical protein
VKNRIPDHGMLVYSPASVLQARGLILDWVRDGVSGTPPQLPALASQVWGCQIAPHAAPALAP